jgi:hypothetical protein
VEVFVGLRAGAAELASDVLGVEHRLGVEISLSRDFQSPVRAELILEVPRVVRFHGATPNFIPALCVQTKSTGAPCAFELQPSN